MLSHIIVIKYSAEIDVKYTLYIYNDKNTFHSQFISLTDFTHEHIHTETLHKISRMISSFKHTHINILIKNNFKK